MTCAEIERLFDAYLDDQLSASLRLEMDAHRLSCRHCQQTLAMMESFSHVLANAADDPVLDDGFADRVMAQVRSCRPSGRKLRLWWSVGLLQAAAVVLFVFLWSTRASGPVLHVGPSALVTSQGEWKGYLSQPIDLAISAGRTVSLDANSVVELAESAFASPADLRDVGASRVLGWIFGSSDGAASLEASADEASL